jgi:hypothetical protein
VRVFRIHASNLRAAAARAPRLGVSRFAVAALGLVVAIVVMVSLPRLRDLGLRENAGDAERTVRRVALLLAPPQAALRSLQQLVASDTILSRSLVDGGWTADGRLRCHGYLFELRAGPASPVVYAWPWLHGRTGRECFASGNATDMLWCDPNRDGSASGPEQPPVDLGDSRWERLP